ncbi:hypothetical protein ACH5RR_030765 [Cinchona calisaya]|uniref:Uncharacterized protein n=1 Tax=Cinchona calisaya TaxID=153742 RepID=A0ABD2YVL6_9GENT
MLIPFVDNFPLKDCSSNEKLLSSANSLSGDTDETDVVDKKMHSISELRNKLVVLLVSKPELLPIEKIFLLVQQTYDHPHQEKIGQRQPWLLISVVVNFIKQEWNFKEEPMMVVLDTNGMITNSNAMDMIWIWGAKPFPFSTLREKELWEKGDMDSATYNQWC